MLFDNISCDTIPLSTGSRIVTLSTLYKIEQGFSLKTIFLDDEVGCEHQFGE